MNAAALIKTSIDMVNEGLISEEEALLRIQPDMLEQLLHPRLDPEAKADVLAQGLPRPPAPHRAKWCLTRTGPRARPNWEKR